MSEEINIEEVDYGRSPVPKSPHFEIIMKKFQAFGGSLSDRKFHAEYVSQIDESISLGMWQTFMRKFRARVKAKTNKLIEKVEDLAVTENQMENSSMRKILAITEMTLDEIVADPELLKKIPVDKRMEWFFKEMKARDDRVKTQMAVREDVRKQTAYDELMSSAQYGAMDVDLVEEESPVQDEPAAIEAPKEVTFDPDDL